MSGGGDGDLDLWSDKCPLEGDWVLGQVDKDHLLNVYTSLTVLVRRERTTFGRGRKWHSLNAAGWLVSPQKAEKPYEFCFVLNPLEITITELSKTYLYGPGFWMQKNFLFQSADFVDPKSAACPGNSYSRYFYVSSLSIFFFFLWYPKKESKKCRSKKKKKKTLLYHFI